MLRAVEVAVLYFGSGSGSGSGSGDAQFNSSKVKKELTQAVATNMSLLFWERFLFFG